MNEKIEHLFLKQKGTLKLNNFGTLNLILHIRHIFTCCGKLS